MAKFREIQNPHKIVDAVQLTEEAIYVSGSEEIKGNPGDWEVKHISPTRGQTHIGLITHENFVKLYEPYDIDDEIRDISEATIEAFQNEEQLEINEFVRDLRESGICRD